ncbi:MAG: TfoX/Sxy family DNA transformation protein [Pirellulaceae bacterium]
MQSAGRNQAVIIHTATGQHLLELETKFADVGFSTTENGLSEPIDNLRNLGPNTAASLRDVGISTIAELERLGPARAFRLVKRKHPESSLNVLWSVAAGLMDRDWRELTRDEKERLKKEAEEGNL